MTMKTFSLLALLTALFISGCATQPKIDPKRDWSKLVGSYSYDQAVAELGKPTVIGEESSGDKVAEWITRRGSRMSFGFGVGGGSYGSRSGVGVGVGSSFSPAPHGDYLRLIFGKDGLLRSWSRTSH